MVFFLMALRLSKRKRPAREEKPLRALPKIAERVFDDKTIEVLLHFLNQGVIKSVDYPVAMGKEAVVFRCTGPKGFLAAKVYKYETTAFKSFRKYIEGDERFSGVRTQLRPLVRAWARKEYSNLRLCRAAGVPVPEPVAQRENVVVMEFLGEAGLPFAKLVEAVVEKPGEMLEAVLDGVKKMYEAGLVHADLSPFNVIVFRGKPYFIDVSQSVLLSHPMAQAFLERDVENILKYFEKLGVKRDKERTLEWIRGG